MDRLEDELRVDADDGLDEEELDEDELSVEEEDESSASSWINVAANTAVVAASPPTKQTQWSTSEISLGALLSMRSPCDQIPVAGSAVLHHLFGPSCWNTGWTLTLDVS